MAGSFPAALTCEGRIKGNRQKAALRHTLRVKSGALLLDRAKGAADRDCRKSAFRVFRHIHVSRKRDPVTVYKSHLAVIHLPALRKRLIPSLRQFQFFLFDHDSCLPFVISLQMFFSVCRIT